MHAAVTIRGKKYKMKRYKQHFSTVAAAALSLMLILSSTSVNAFSPAAHANAADGVSSPALSQEDISFAATRQSVMQVQQLAAALYNQNLVYFGSRNGGFSWDTEGKKRSWTYYNGIMMDAYLMADDCLTPDDQRAYPAVNSFYDANISYSNSVAAVDTTGNTDNYYRENELDSIPPVRAIFDLLRSDVPTEDEREKYTGMILYVYDLMANHYPTVDGTDGNFKHKHGNVSSSWNTYPVALDGLYMAQPFFMELASAVEDGYIDGTDAGIVPDEIYADVAARMCWVGAHLYDAETGLYNHGWGPDAGVNEQFWLRAVGWYAAALADVISMLPDSYSSQKADLITIEKRLFDGMIEYQDAETGMWYNVIDHDGTLKRSATYNLLESSGTALMAYAMLKSYSEGYIESTYCEAGLRAFNGTVQTQLDGDHLRNIYKSSGVGTTPESYLTNTYQVNEAKGVGPLMMAACFASSAAERYYGPIPEVQGDVNADGMFQVSDIVLLRKWLLAVPNTYLPNWKAGDINADGRLNACDLTLLKRMMLDAD
mgnify:CR=1 FL=1